MKILITADTHLNKTIFKGVMDRKLTDMPFRNADFTRALSWVVDKAIDEIKPNLFVINGDIYDTYNPGNQIRKFFSEQLKRLNDAEIPVILLIGNHDISMKTHALSDISGLGLKKVLVIEKKTISKFEGHRLLLFPYSLDIEQNNVSIKDEFYNFIKEAEEKPTNLPTLFFGHFPVNGAKFNIDTEDSFYDEETITTTTTLIKGFTNRNQLDISNSDLNKLNANYVFLGDFHSYQVLKTKNISMYSGSLEKTDFSEINQKKGFIVYDTEVEEKPIIGKTRFIEYPNCRPMLQLRGNMAKMKEIFDAIDYSKYGDAIIKLYFEGNHNELVEYGNGLEDFKAIIKEKMNPIYIHNVQKVIDSEWEEVQSELVKEILEKENLEKDDIIEVVKEMINEKPCDDKEKLELMKLATEIYKETMEAK